MFDNVIMSQFFELFTIKQEPDLDIVSDGECDTISDDNGCNVLDNVNKTDMLNDQFDRTDDHNALTTNVKQEATENNNVPIDCDTTKNRSSFQCLQCSKVYTTKQALKLHVDSIHMQLRPFTCELCSRSFADKYTLTTHARIHSGERPYKCPFCEKTFVQHSAVTKHKRTHTKEKPFQCEVCLKAFSDRSSLIPHRKIHTGELHRNRSFRCEICNAGFIKNSHLVRHNTSKSHLEKLMKIEERASTIKVEGSDADALL